MAPTVASAQSHGKVLVVLSSAHTLDLRDGKTYKTGYYLNELATPLKQIVDAGYTPVFANPKGDTPSMDENSNNKMFFGGDDAKREDALKFVDGFAGIKHPMKLATVAAKGTQGYVGLFMPGGHAPMQDLLKDRNLGKILVSFHDTGRPTGIICHGPIALLSTMKNPAAFDKALIADDTASIDQLKQGWPYAGYKLTVFSNAEEKQLEGEGKPLGGQVQFYTDEALAKAGADVQIAEPWKSNVVVDRELITGQQPFSDHALGDALVAKLNQQASK
jgi:putative intracellular protease/amidase